MSDIHEEYLVNVLSLAAAKIVPKAARLIFVTQSPNDTRTKTAQAVSLDRIAVPVANRYPAL